MAKPALALVFPFQSELEAFLAGLEPHAAQPAAGASAPLFRSLRQYPLREQTFGSLRTYSLESHPRWRLAVCGQGKVETALACQILAQALAPSAYLLLGSACALDPDLKSGDLVLADPCIEYDFQHGPPPSGADPAPKPEHHPTFKSKHPFPVTASGLSVTGLPGSGISGAAFSPRLQSGPVLSADRNVFDPGEKLALRQAYSALAVAWEGAGFHRFLRRNQAKGWEIRLITEAAQEGRPTLRDLHRRMQAGFAGLVSLVRNFE